MIVRFRHGLSVIVARLPRALRGGNRFAAHRPGALFGLVGIAVLWAGVLHGLAVERRQAIDGAFADTAKFARAFEERILGTIRAVDQTLYYIRASYARDPAHFDILLWSGHSQSLDDLVFQISNIDKDGYLPGINGIELVQRIRGVKAKRGMCRVPILGLIADVTAAMRERCLLAGMNDVVAKPIDLRRLRPAIVRIAQALRSAHEAIARFMTVTAFVT